MRLIILRGGKDSPFLTYLRVVKYTSMKVKVDRSLCIGAASCVVIAPKVFQLDSEAKAVVVDPSGADDETILDAAKSCPVLAIIVEDDSGKQIWPET